VDLQKAYDKVDRAKLWECLASKLAVPASLIQVIRNMYVESKGVVCVGQQARSSFDSNIGVKQGDGASPELFALYFDRVYACL
jgi:hypothetical protein